MSVDEPRADPAEPPTPTGEPLVDKRYVLAWWGFALFWFLVAPVFGLIASMKLDDPDFLQNIEWLQFGRLRISHVNGVIFGLFSTTMFGLMAYAIPKLCGRPLANMRLAWFGLLAFNTAVFGGEVGLLLGYMQAIEAGEYGLVADLVLIAGFAALLVVFLQTIVQRRHKRMYVSLWYWTAALLWTLLNVILGVLVLPYGPRGVASAATHGFYLHNVVGLWITPIGLGAAYYLVPVAARARLYSHKLSLIGFWGLAFFYPLNGVHHYIYSPIADWAQSIAIVASMMLLVPVIAFTVNIWGTMWGRWREFSGQNYVIRFAILGALWYLLTCIQGPTQALRGMQELTHFGDYNVGHAHSSVFGTFAIWSMAAIYFGLPRLFGIGIWSTALAAWHFWLEVVGFALMFGALTIAGFLQGAMVSSFDQSWVDSMVAIRPYWLARTVGGTLMDIGLALFVYNVVVSLVMRRPPPAEDVAGIRETVPTRRAATTAGSVGSDA